jgi:hypothetical protein
LFITASPNGLVIFRKRLAEKFTRLPLLGESPMAEECEKREARADDWYSDPHRPVTASIQPRLAYKKASIDDRYI